MDRQKILIVDDEEAMREMLSVLLSDLGCDVVFASDGNEAITHAMKEKPDLILLDIMMPKMDGFEMCRELRTRMEISSIPVLMITGRDSKDSLKRGLQAGAEDVMFKPVNAAELKLRVKTILQLNRFRMLAAERSQFRWVVDQSRSAYLTINKEEYVVYMNPRAKSLFGVEDYSYSDAKKKLFDILGSGFSKVPEAAWNNWPTAEEPLFLVSPETEDEHAQWLKLEFVPSEGFPLGQKMLHLTDVTEEMSKHHNLWQFEHMVSHKLRTPLMGLINSLDTLDVDSLNLSDDVAQNLKEATRSATELHSSIDGILKYLESSSRQLESKSTSVSKLKELLVGIGERLAIAIPSPDIDSALESKTLLITEESLLLVLTELLANSIKFHPENKPDIQLCVSEVANALNIEVIDDGRHLSPDVLKKLMLPFYQVEKDFTGEVPGMGLGLSIISSLLAGIGGSCDVKNREDADGLIVNLNIPIK